MRTRKEIQKALDDIIKNKNRLESELKSLEEQEQDALSASAVAILNNSPADNAKVSAVRSKIEATQMALRIADTLLSESRQEMDEAIRAEANAPWIAFEKTVPERLSKLLSLLGENGVKGAMDSIQDELDACGGRAGNVGRDSNTVSIRLRQICKEGTTNLLHLWELVDRLEHLIEGRRYPASKNIKDGKIVGFGRMPK